MLYLILVYLRSLKMAKRCHINICYMTTSYPILGSGQNIGKQNIESQNIESQNIESQNIERKISKAKYRNRRISKPQNIEVAKNRIAKKIEYAKYRNRKKIVLQNIEWKKYRKTKYRQIKYRMQNIQRKISNDKRFTTKSLNCENQIFGKIKNCY